MTYSSTVELYLSVEAAIQFEETLAVFDRITAGTAPDARALETAPLLPSARPIANSAISMAGSSGISGTESLRSPPAGKGPSLPPWTDLSCAPPPSCPLLSCLVPLI
ncbi:hypothetical protein ACFPYM_24935 [Methylobacterium hispanicum]|jgi:hypothetical protein|uniref:hypothetical protein n=1 Tax=Methylobacterium TaxID=407 RepID=UPI000837542D|nr:MULTISPECIES: hypothetical protein [Methylobacterium]